MPTISAPNAIEELFELGGRAIGDYVEMLPVDPFYRLIWQDGVSLDYNADVDAVASAIARINPADADGYRRFLEFSEAVFREGYLKLGTVPFQDVWSMVRVVPQPANGAARASARHSPRGVGWQDRAGWTKANSSSRS